MTRKDMRNSLRCRFPSSSTAHSPASSSIPHSRAPLDILMEHTPDRSGPSYEVSRHAEMCATICAANHHRARAAHLLSSRECCTRTRPLQLQINIPPNQINVCTRLHTVPRPAWPVAMLHTPELKKGSCYIHNGTCPEIAGALDKILHEMRDSPA
jgi:hypothetical protein